MTYSIVAFDRETMQWGVAVASKAMCVGAHVPWGAGGVGAVATQAYHDLRYGFEGLDALKQGRDAAGVVAELTTDDPESVFRQLGVVDAEGRAATFTGERCTAWAGGLSGDSWAVQGNILAGPHVVAAMRESWDATKDEPKLERRLLAALTAGDRAGGDKRGRQSAALLVVRDGAGYGGNDDIAADLRVDDHPDPCTELARLLDLHELYLTASTEDEKVPVDAALREELETRARDRGHGSFDAWVGTENYEMRVGGDWIDRRILAILRQDAS